MKTTIPAVLALAVASAGAPPSAEDFLFRAAVRNQTVVFLPTSEIRSEADADSYLRWAAEVHAARGGQLRAVWDREDSIPLSAVQKYDAAFLLRPGDDALDPSGRVRFVVKDADGEAGRFSLSLASALAPGVATPEVCFTNAWVLSRERLFERWRTEIAGGDASGVRAQMRALRDSGRYKAVGGEVWEREVAGFVEKTPALWPALKVVNATGRRVAVSVLGGRNGEYFAPGERKTIRVGKMPEGGKISWMARDAEPEELCERDFSSVREGEYPWDPLGAADAEVVLDGRLGERKDNPRVDLSSLLPAVSDSGSARPELRSVRVFYADALSRPENAPVLKSEYGSPQIEIAPHRAVRRIVLDAPGFQTLQIGWRDDQPTNLINGMCSADPVLALDGSSKMRPAALPWPDITVKNDSGLEIAIESDVLKQEEQRDVLKGMVKTISLDALWRDSVKERVLTNSVKLFATSASGATLLSTNFVVVRGQAKVEIVVRAPRGPATPDARQAAGDRRQATNAAPDARQATADNYSGRGRASRGPTATPPLPPLPDRDVQKELGDKLKRRVRAMTGDSTVRESSDNKKIATDHLLYLQEFWPHDPKFESNTWVRAFRQCVSHFAHCKNGCDSCNGLRKSTLARRLDPQTEVFEVFGDWKAEDQRDFRQEALDKPNDNFQTLESIRLLKNAPAWAGRIRRCLDDGDPLTQREELPRALSLWDGTLGKGHQNQGALLRAAFRHAELCESASCPECHDFRNAVRYSGSFEERRLGLLKAILCSPDAFRGKAEEPLKASELDAFAVKIEEYRRETQKGNQAK